MAVATDTILKKMKQELAEAHQKSADVAAMTKHVANIRLLCELLLEEEPSPDAEHAMTAREMKAMMGNEVAERQSKQAHDPIDHDEANGKSLFDF
ncbi:DUF5327 family protein [Lentibacillus salicampi]|uniref:YwdI family protein n=1 Tax=Lentibacillus salicampi TaxID=175306 RepID=A0A4Y9AGA1_9BACI|nr:DUF5327 family protein [Lentibacillus salicampi]TFJ93411.1 hypothetical protein E4U82_07020 [Lentibacillus salicampi]